MRSKTRSFLWAQPARRLPQQTANPLLLPTTRYIPSAGSRWRTLMMLARTWLNGSPPGQKISLRITGVLSFALEGARESWRQQTGAHPMPVALIWGWASPCLMSRPTTPTSHASYHWSFTTFSCVSSGLPTWPRRSCSSPEALARLMNYLKYSPYYRPAKYENTCPWCYLIKPTGLR